MALLFSASVSVAATCKSDPNECTPKKLCKEATNLKGGNTVWSIASGSAKHVTYAQGLGMSCGVTEETAAEEVVTNFKQAFTSQSKLRRQQLQYALKKFGYYSYGTDGLWGKGTSSGFDKFVSGNELQSKTEAQVFKSLLSKVDVPSSFAAPLVKKTCSESNTQGCTTTEICKKATLLINGKPKWRPPSSGANYVKEAKSRGLTCAVTEYSTAGPLSSTKPIDIITCFGPALFTFGLIGFNCGKVF